MCEKDNKIIKKKGYFLQFSVIAFYYSKDLSVFNVATS